MSGILPGDTLEHNCHLADSPPTASSSSLWKKRPNHRTDAIRCPGS